MSWCSIIQVNPKERNVSLPWQPRQSTHPTCSFYPEAELWKQPSTLGCGSPAASLLEISTSCICLETFSFIYYTSTKIKIKAPVVKRERRNVRDTGALRQVRSSHHPTVNTTTGARKQQSEARAAPGFRPASRSVAESRRHITAQVVSLEKSWGGQSSSVIVTRKVWLVERKQRAGCKPLDVQINEDYRLKLQSQTNLRAWCEGGVNPAHGTTAGGRVRYCTRLCLGFHFRRTVSARILNSSTAEKLMLVIYIYPLVTLLVSYRSF